MLQWKQQLNAGNWRKQIIVRWTTAIKVFALFLVHNHTWQLLFVTVKCKHNHGNRELQVAMSKWSWLMNIECMGIHHKALNACKKYQFVAA